MRSCYHTLPQPLLLLLEPVVFAPCNTNQCPHYCIQATLKLTVLVLNISTYVASYISIQKDDYIITHKALDMNA